MVMEADKYFFLSGGDRALGELLKVSGFYVDVVSKIISVFRVN